MATSIRRSLSAWAVFYLAFASATHADDGERNGRNRNSLRTPTPSPTITPPADNLNGRNRNGRNRNGRNRNRTPNPPVIDPLPVAIVDPPPLNPPVIVTPPPDAPLPVVPPPDAPLPVVPPPDTPLPVVPPPVVDPPPIALNGGGSLIPSLADIQSLQTAIAAAFGFTGGSYGDNCVQCATGDNMGALVRLGFHDAAGGGGGANGCIDFSVGGNNGLQAVVGQLQAVWTPTFSGVISFADTIVVAANLAIQFASTPSGNNNGLPATQTLFLPLRVGRVDLPNCNGIDTEIPPTSLSFPEMNAFFNRRFGLTPTEIVAALGAHSLGRAEASNTGIEGGWISFQSSFTNNYFSTLLGIPWALDNNNVFRANNQNIMLKVDTELAISPSSACTFFNARTFNGGDGACPLNALGLGAVQQFADFNGGTAAWYGVFESAWTKMTEAGQTGLVAPA